MKVDVRIIAATNRDLEKAVADRSLPRGSVLPAQRLSRSRSRRCGSGVEDIPLLVWTFVDEFSQAFGKTIDVDLPRTAWRRSQRYPWPGNVRELRNVVERAMIVATGPHLVLEPPRGGRSGPGEDDATLVDMET